MHRFVIVSLIILLGCQNQAEAIKALEAWERDKGQKLSSALTKRVVTEWGEFRITPSPISVCDGSGLGSATVRWTSAKAGSFEIRIGREDASENETILYAAVTDRGQGVTRKWVRDGQRFFVRESNSGQIVAAETIRVTAEGCP